MTALIIHASKDAESMRALFISPGTAVAKARRLVNTGWQVHVTDAEGHIFHPDRFDDLLMAERAKRPK